MRWAILLFAVLWASDARADQSAGAMFVEWHGSWWSAHTVSRTNDGNAVVHYDGWGSEWDEVVTPARIAHATDDGKLFVSWGGSWWPATIVRQQRGGGLLVHYDGWGNEWDEVVDAKRVVHLSRSVSR